MIFFSWFSLLSFEKQQLWLARGPRNSLHIRFVQRRLRLFYFPAEDNGAVIELTEGTEQEREESLVKESGEILESVQVILW